MPEHAKTPEDLRNDQRKLLRMLNKMSNYLNDLMNVQISDTKAQELEAQRLKNLQVAPHKIYKPKTGEEKYK